MAVVGSRVYVVWLNNTSGNSNLLFSPSSNNGGNFGSVVRITTPTTQNAANDQIVAAGSDVYIVWEQNVSASGNSILFRASTNNGTSFGPIITVISSGASCGSGCTISTSVAPQIAAVGNNVYVVWRATTSKGVNEILFKASTTNGSNLATATALTLSGTAYGSAQPQIEALTTYVYVTWSDLGTVGRAQTFFSASSDSGTSFAYVAAHTLSSTLPGETDLYQKMAASGSSVYVTWTNDTMTTDNTMFAASTNNGATFGAALNLNKAVVTDIYPDLAASAGNVYVVWIEASGVNPGALYRVSSNNGSTFSSTINLSNTQGTSISVCPSPVNCLTIAASGSNVYTAWIESSATNNGVYFVSSSDNGSTFGAPQNLSNDSVSNNPVVAGSGSYAFVAWEDDTTGNGDIYFETGTVPFDFSISNSGPITVTQGSSGSNKFNVTLQSGSSQSVSLACTGGLPVGASCSFSPASGQPTISSNLTISTLTSTPVGSYTLTVNGTAGSLTHSTQVTLMVNPSVTVGGTVLGIDKLALLAPYLVLALTISAILALPILYYRRKHRLWMRALYSRTN
jgi:hypothetical protein